MPYQQPQGAKLRRRGDMGRRIRATLTDNLDNVYRNPASQASHPGCDQAGFEARDRLPRAGGTKGQLM
jgi:hypothetical protein